MHVIKDYKDEWRVQEYLLLTFFISWISWGILILLTALQVVKFMSVIGVVLFTIGGFGPTLSAIICIEGKLTLKRLGEFIFGHKKHTFWYLLAFAVCEVAIIWLSSLGANPDMPYYVLPIVFIITTLFGGGNEELGWRGILQPLIERLAAKLTKNSYASFVLSTLLVGTIWTIWHVPLWFVVGSAQQNIPFVWFALSCLALSFWLACIYRKTHSIFYCMILHGLTNLLMSAFVIDVNAILVLGFMVLTVAAAFLGGRDKSIAKLRIKSS